MTIYRRYRDGRWRIACVKLPDGTLRRICGIAPSTTNTKLAALAAEREHAHRPLRSAMITAHIPAETTRPTRDALGVDECERLIDAAQNEGEPWATAVLLAGESDLRIGEVLALDWSDCDLETNTITLVQAKIGEPRCEAP